MDSYHRMRFCVTKERRYTGAFSDALFRDRWKHSFQMNFWKPGQSEPTPVKFESDQEVSALKLRIELCLEACIGVRTEELKTGMLAKLRADEDGSAW